MKTLRTASARLNAKTLDQIFINMVEQGYDCPPFVSNAILQTAKSVFSPDQSNSDILNLGQIKILVISNSEPAGKPLLDSQMKTVRPRYSLGQSILALFPNFVTLLMKNPSMPSISR